MVIKQWDDWDGQVFKISSEGLKGMLEGEFTPKEQKKIKKIAKDFAEKLGLEFVHNLKEGWEEELLRTGRVLSRDGTKKLTTKEEIKEELGNRREINFFAKKKFGSWKIIEKLRKPKHLRRD